MKKLFITAILLIGGLTVVQESKAQVRVGVNINIGDQPSWRATGYDYAEYYYLSDIESYYYVPRRQFIYLSNGRWVFSASLPSRHRHYDLHSGYKVVVNRPNAYHYFEQDRQRYGRKQNFRNERYDRHDNRRHQGWQKKRRGHR